MHPSSACRASESERERARKSANQSRGNREEKETAHFTGFKHSAPERKEKKKNEGRPGRI